MENRKRQETGELDSISDPIIKNVETLTLCENAFRILTASERALHRFWTKV